MLSICFYDTTGTQSIHKELEKKISKFHSREDTILYASCFDANAGIFEAILTPEDSVFSDELNHASIIDGLRLCKAKKERYLHRNMEDLEAKLKSSDGRIKLIVTDGVFSMDGNIAPLPEIVRLAKKYNALTFVDDVNFLKLSSNFMTINFPLFSVTQRVSLASLVGAQKTITTCRVRLTLLTRHLEKH